MSGADELDDLSQPAVMEDGSSGRHGFPLDPYRLRRAFRARWQWLLLAAVLGVLFGYGWVKLFITGGYETTAVLRYEGQLDAVEALPSRTPLGPAADALTHEPVLRKIADEIGFEGALADLGASIGYAIDPRSGTLHIIVGGSTGEEAADYARIVTDVFLRYHKERQARRIEIEIARVQTRIDAAKRELESAREAFETFREKHGLTHLSTEQQSIVESVATRRADSELAAYEIRALEAQARALETQLANTRKTSVVAGGGSPERAIYDQLRQELASAKGTLSPDHPRVQALEHQVGELRQQLRSGGASSLGGGLATVNPMYQVLQEQLRDVKSQLAALRERQKGLAEMADKAAVRFDSFADIEGEASALLAEVEVNENLLSDLRRKEASLEDALSDPPSGFAVLDPGPVPEYPEPSKMKLFIFGLISMLGLGVGLFFVLYPELRGLRVKTPAEVAFWGRGPVLGSTAWPDDPSGLNELVADLDDLTPNARGHVLVIGGTAEDSRLVGELAERMNEEQRWANDGIAAPSNGPTVVHHQPSPPRTPSPLYTPPPPPTGPYPIGGDGRPTAAPSAAPAGTPAPPSREPDRLARRAGGFHIQLRLEAWTGPPKGHVLRRAARLADRVLVLVRSEAVSALQLNGIQRRLGRTDGIGYIVVGLAAELTDLPDRAGDVAGFWESGTRG